MGEYWSQPSKGYSNEPLVTTNERGERVVGGGNIYKGRLTADGGLDTESYDRLVAAYDKIKSSTNGALENWERSRTGTANQRKAAMDKLFKAYKSDGTYTGTRADFDKWYAMRNNEMLSSALTWTGSFMGNPTAAADGTPIGTRNINGQLMSFNGFGWNAV